MKKFFIAGASSYIGKELISYIKKKNLKLFASYYRNNIFKKSENKVCYIQLDLRKKNSIKKIIKINPDVIINLAALKKK